MVDRLLQAGIGAVGAQFERIMGAGFDAPAPVTMPIPSFGPPPQVGGNPFGGAPVQVYSQPFGRPPQVSGNPFGELGGVGSQPFGPPPQVSGNPFPGLNGPAQAEPIIPKTTGPTGNGKAGNAPGLGSSQWADLINEEAQRYADAPELAEVAQAMVELESHGNPNAQGVVVTSGPYAGQQAQGLGQIMPGNYPGVNLLDPRTNVQKMLEMLHERYKRYGNWDSAVASYFGAVDAQGRPTTQTDDNGTSGIQYVAIVNGHRQTIRNSQPKTTTVAGPQAQQMITAAQSRLGQAYELGGRRAGHATWDCSETTAWFYEQIGKTLPWNAQAQYNMTQRVDRTQLQPGDLVFFQGTYAGNPGEVVTHVGMFAGYDAQGNPLMIHAGSNGTEYANLNERYYQDHWYGAGRVA